MPIPGVFNYAVISACDKIFWKLIDYYFENDSVHACVILGDFVIDYHDACNWKNKFFEAGNAHSSEAPDFTL